MARINVAIVGCGRISDLHQLGYRKVKDAEIVAVYDQSRRKAQAKARSWEVGRVCESYEAVLSDPNIDLVELLIPHHLHAEMAIAACRAGKHVSLQKPIALSLADADRLLDEAEKAGVVLRIYENAIFYPPYVRAKQLVDAGEIGIPRMIRIHFNTGKRSKGWDVSIDAWMWRLDEKRCGGGPLVFDHGHHLFSMAYDLMGDVECVTAWIDKTPVIPTKSLDAPATVMLKFKKPRCYGVMDFVHTPSMHIDSDYYADDNRIEVVGERGVVFINRWTAKTVDLPALLMFRDGQTTPIPVERVEWYEAFIDCTRHLIDVLMGKQMTPRLDGKSGRAILQLMQAVQISAREHREVQVDEVQTIGP